MFKDHYQAVSYCILNNITRYVILGDPRKGWYISKKSKILKVKDIPEYWKRR